MQVMIQQTKPPVQMSNYGQKQVANPGNSFSQLLAATNETSAQGASGLGEIVQTLLSSSDLLELFNNPNEVEDEDIQALLNELPPEIKETLVEMLENPVEEASDMKNPSAELKMVFLLQALYNDQQQSLTNSMKKDIHLLIEKWFPALKLDRNDSISKQVQQIFEQVTKQMNGQVTKDKQTFHKIMENLTVVNKVQNYAEQAFQRYVPMKQGDQKATATKELQSLQSPLSTLEQWSLKVPASQDDGQKQQFVREIQQIITRGKLFVTENGFAKMQIKLNPEHLGTIEIQLIQKQGEIAARIVASSQSAKDALDSQLSQLKQAFTGQNIEFEKIEVFLHGEEQAFRFHDQGNQNQGDQKHSEQQTHDDAETNHLSFEEQLSQMVLNEKV